MPKKSEPGIVEALEDAIAYLEMGIRLQCTYSLDNGEPGRCKKKLKVYRRLLKEARADRKGGGE